MLQFNNCCHALIITRTARNYTHTTFRACVVSRSNSIRLYLCLYTKSLMRYKVNLMNLDEQDNKKAELPYSISRTEISLSASDMKKKHLFTL